MPISTATRSQAEASKEPVVVRWILTVLAVAILALFLLVPLAAVFSEAFSQGVRVYVAAVRDPDSISAIRLTLLTAVTVVPLNMLFGIAAAWAVTKFRFRGKALVNTLIDLPSAVSPVIAGLVFVLLFGRFGFFGPWLEAHNLKIIFAFPGIALATAFVTFPFVARELIPLMEAQGSDEEQAAMVLGAGGWQILRRITLPNIKWALVYGLILCNARAMGEFGAVTVVTGSGIAGMTSTIPLQVENYYDDCNYSSAFALASLLSILGLITLVVKKLLEMKIERAMARNEAEN